MGLSQASPVSLVLDKTRNKILHVKESLHQLGVAGTQSPDGEVESLAEGAGVAVLALAGFIRPLSVKVCSSTVGEVSTIRLTRLPVTIVAQNIQSGGVHPHILLGGDDNELLEFEYFEWDLILISDSQPDHQSSGGMETLLMNVRHHDVLQFVHQLMILLNTR